MNNNDDSITSLSFSDQDIHINCFSDTVGKNVIKILENVGSALNKVGESMEKIDSSDINVKDVISSSLGSYDCEVCAAKEERAWVAPPLPVPTGGLEDLVDKYNQLLRNLDRENTENPDNLNMTCEIANSAPERVWLSADLSPEKQEGEEVEETPISAFSHQIAQMLPVQAALSQAQQGAQLIDGDEEEDEDDEGEEDEDDAEDGEYDEAKGEDGADGEPYFDNGDEEEDEEEDEWDDDNDLGYVTVTISEREFFEMEEDCARRLAQSEQLRAAVRDLGVGVGTVGTRDRSSSAPAAVVGSGSATATASSVISHDDLDEDIAAAEEMLARMERSADTAGHSLGSQVGGLVTQVLQGFTGRGAAAVPTVRASQKAQPSLSAEEKRRSIEILREARSRDIQGQQRFYGVDGMHSVFNLKIIFEPYKTGFEETKHFKPTKGTIIAGRFRVSEILGQAAFSTALQCEDLEPAENGPQWVCLKVIKNNKDFFDQSLDEIKLLQYINSMGDADKHNVLKLVDYFYCREHLFIVCELLRENLYDFGKYIRDNDEQPYFTFPRLKSITRQVLEALRFIHSLGLIHCDIKPENIVIKSYSRCEVKLIDFGSSCYVTDHLTSYIQSRSYRAPEVILGLPYDYKIDMWSVGAVLAEMHTGYVLFQNDSVATMLARISGILGPMPPAMIKTGREATKFYTVAGIPYDRTDSGEFSLIYPKRTSLQTRLHLPAELSKDEADFLDLVRWMLETLPDKRPYASDCLTHDWLKDSYGPYDT